MNKPTKKLTPKEYMQVVKAMGLQDPVGLYNAYDDAYAKENLEWFDSLMLDAPTGEEMELMFLRTAS